MTVRVLKSYTHERFSRLTIQHRSNSKFYQTVTYMDGRLWQKSLKTTDLDAAMQMAEAWYRRRQRDSLAEQRRHPIDLSNPTMKELFVSYSAELSQQKRAWADMKWGPIEDFWQGRTAVSVTPQLLKEFYRWRRRMKTRNGTILKNHTLHKDVILLRQILKHALEEGHIDHLPLIPKVGTIEPDPRPWLTRDEWDQLLDVSLQRQMDAEDNPKLARQREDLDDQMRFMVATMCRVDEVRGIHFRDGRIEKNTSTGENILICAVSGKRGQRTIVGRTMAATIFARRQKRAGDPAALLFPEHHRDAFRELLIAANLRTDPKTGFTRNFKSLRATAISFEILGSENPNLLLIARNAGTSLQMIDQFYARRLSAEMGADILTARRKSRK